jgi:uncharacterized protein YodC (DUF2158 family)
MRGRAMMVLATAALAGSFLAAGAQARGGGHGGRGGGGHMGHIGAHAGHFGGAHIGVHAARFAGARIGGFGEGRMAGLRRTRFGVLAWPGFGQTDYTDFGWPGFGQTNYTGSAWPGFGQPYYTGYYAPIFVPSAVSDQLAGDATGPDDVPPPSNPAIQNQTDPALRIGSLVRLRSGGPLMTVKDVKGDQVDCIWADVNGQINTDSFPIVVLRLTFRS